MKQKVVNIILLTIFLLLSKVSHAQYDNYWAWSPYHALDFNNHIPVPKLSSSIGPKGDYQWNSSSICDSAGKLILYISGDTIYDREGKPLPYFLSSNLYFNTTRREFYQIVPKTIHEYYIFKTIDDNRSLQYAIVDMRLNNGYGDVEKGNENIVMAQGSFYGLEVVSKKMGGYWLLSKLTSDSFFAFPIDNSGIGKPVKTYFKELDQSWKPLYRYKITASHDCKFIVTTNPAPDLGDYSTVYAYDFDNNTGKLSNQRLIAKDFRPNRGDTSGGFFYGCAFSPNDSLFYVVHMPQIKVKATFSTVIPLTPPPYDVLYQFSRYAPDIGSSLNKFYSLDSIIVYNSALFNVLDDIKSGPDDKIYLSRFSSAFLGVINNPNVQGSGCNVIFDAIKCPCNAKYSCRGGLFPLTIHNNNSIKFITSNQCGPILFTAKSDSIFKTFTWYIQDLNGNQLDTLKGVQVSYNFKKQGKYIIILQGNSNVGYRKWYTDTIISLSKPIAYFTTNQDTVCQFSKVIFTDQSTTDTLNPNINKEWIWDFGDGDTSHRQNPVHVFKKIGLSQIKLVFSNGFCSDTFSKNIYTQAAPKPGLKALPPTGCNPLNIKIISQDSGFVKSYFYNSGNGSTDSVKNPTFNYSLPGKYYILQILQAPGGCITKDSILVSVRPSVKKSDKVDVSFATIENGLVRIAWNKLASATIYYLYRYQDNDTNNISLVKQTDNNLFLDQGLNISYHFYSYFVITSDSCGNLSGKGRIGRTILLRGNNEDNLDSKLFWNSYQDWPDGVKQYYVLSQDQNGNMSTLNITTTTTYLDANFLDINKYQNCYMIRAVSNDTPFISESNIVCINQLPKIFIPDAFSPNADSLNSTFLPITEGIKYYKINIYNRWGELIFYSDNAKKGWDGNFKGNKAPEGIYIYMITAKGYNGELFYRNGNLLLIR
jgi:gliding motility-associated-like protein